VETSYLFPSGKVALIQMVPRSRHLVGVFPFNCSDFQYGGNTSQTFFWLANRKPWIWSPASDVLTWLGDTYNSYQAERKVTCNPMIEGSRILLAVIPNAFIIYHSQSNSLEDVGFFSVCVGVTRLQLSITSSLDLKFFSRFGKLYFLSSPVDLWFGWCFWHSEWNWFILQHFLSEV